MLVIAYITAGSTIKKYPNVTHSYHVYQVCCYPANHSYVGHGLRVRRSRSLFPVNDYHVGIVPSQNLPGDFFQPRPVTALQEPMGDEVRGHRWNHVGCDHRIAILVVQILAHVPVVARVQTVPWGDLFRFFRKHVHRPG